MKLHHVLTFVLAFIGCLSETFAMDWTPPDAPIPQEILKEAELDARAKRYEIALAKHVWFHENALKIDPALSGVRLSFALSSWKRLGEDYPPALEKLRQTRDDLLTQAREGKNIDKGFHDLASLNKTLDEESKTTEAFKVLVEKNPAAAKKAFVHVKPALVKDKEYALYLKYIDAMKEFLQIKHFYELHQHMAKEKKFGAHLLEFAEKSFRNKSSTLVAVLTVNDRKAEATEIADLAKKELDDKSFHKELDDALEGTVPDAWP